MVIVITYQGHNNSMYNGHKNMGTHYTWQNTVIFLFLKNVLYNYKQEKINYNTG